MQRIELTIPADMCGELKKLIKKTSKYIKDVSCDYGSVYKKTYRHYFDGDIVKMVHSVMDVVVYIPDENDWYLVATVIEGDLFVTNHKEKLILKNGHGASYNICDACKHRQWKKSFIVRNRTTNEEMQIGSECAKKFGIGTMSAIYNLTSALYESYTLPVEEGLEPALWPSRFKDTHAVRSVEVSVMVQAAKKYYDENNGVWKKGYYTDNGFYTPSESAADIASTIDEFLPNDDDEYYVELMEYLRHLEVDVYNEFETKMRDMANDYYIAASESAVAFFAIKKYENYKKEKEAKEKGIYIPKRNDYIRVLGKIVNKTTKQGYYGDYIEYEIFNDIDNNVYKRAGVLPLNKDGNVDGYAYVDNVFNGNYTLSRVTKGRKKNLELANENIKSA